MITLSPRWRAILSAALASISVLAVAILWGLGAWTGEDFMAPAGTRPGDSGTWFDLYFTCPQDEPTWSGGLDETLAADIDGAEATIDVAAFDFDSQSITDALIGAHRRGVRVRVVVDSDNAELDQPLELIDVGIPVVEDNRSALMHNKFAVIDGAIIWTGSWNFTDNGTYRNNNHAIRIRSDELAANYTAEFEEMFLRGEFGCNSPAATPYPRITIEGTVVETYFAPEDGVMDRVREVVANAGESVRFMAFAFTDNELGTMMRQQAAAGLLVEGVFESRGTGSVYSQFAAMQQAGLLVWRDGNSAIMHHKVIIIDASIVILGSSNMTASAEA